MSDDTANTPQEERKVLETKYIKDMRDYLAFLIVFAGILIILLLAIGQGCSMSAPDKGFGYALTSLLPVIGTWVGTVLAFYFSKENFMVASNSIIDSAKQIASGQRLTTVAATSAMIPLDALYVVRITDTEGADKQLLSKILKDLDANMKNRIPVVNAKNYPLYMIHRSAIETYITAEAMAGIDIQKLTLKDFLALGEAKYSNAFGLVSTKETLADAKREMDKIAFRQDVFVSERGGVQEPILGLITNNEIEKQGRL